MLNNQKVNCMQSLNVTVTKMKHRTNHHVKGAVLLLSDALF